MKQIYLDMDGVLADFDKKKFAVFGPKAMDIEDREMWTIVHNEYPNWFLELEPMPDMKLLWNFTRPHKPIVLTALSRTNPYRIVQQKIQWVHKHLDHDVPVIVCMRSHKKDYANTDAILVDDHEDNVKQFSLHGGVGILHKTAALSIAALQSIL